MESKLQERRNQITYHLYLKLHGPDAIYKPLYEYLSKIRAQRVGRDYPELWYFTGSPDNREEYEQEIFSSINSNVPQNIVEHPGIAWRVFIMSPSGHNSCAGGFLPIARDNA